MLNAFSERTKKYETIRQFKLPFNPCTLASTQPYMGVEFAADVVQNNWYADILLKDIAAFFYMDIDVTVEKIMILL